MRKLNFKKILIGLGITVLVVLVVASFVLEDEEVSDQQQVFPSPEIPKTFEGDYDVEFEINEREINLPSSAPAATVTQTIPFTEQRALEIAEGFGLGQNYNTVNDVRKGKTYFWRESQSSLTIYTQTNELVYTFGVIFPTADEDLADEEIVSLAKDFLIQNNLFEENETDFSFLTYLDINSEEIRITNKENASAFRVNFSPIKLDYKIVTLDPQSSPITLWVATDGTVFKAEIKYLGNINISEKSYNLKNLQEIKDSVKEATLVSIDDGNIYPGDLASNDLQNAVIENIELAYLVNEKDVKLIQPIYIMTGEATINARSRVNITLYLPALK